MREDLLHFVWQYQKLPKPKLFTSRGERLKVLHPGTPNAHSGPDFFNAKLVIGGQVWAGNVEVHIKASDWYHHGHEHDERYGNVILHLVWENDVEVYHRGQTIIPALELKSCMPDKLLAAYNKLFHIRNQQFINCESQVGRVDPFLLGHWLERLYFERLESKSREIEGELSLNHHDWEQVLFLRLLKNFGLNVNGDDFLEIGKAIDFSHIRKLGTNTFQLESLLFGLSGLLQGEARPDRYCQELQAEFDYLCKRFTLDVPVSVKPEFARLRPANFPTIRLSQFAVLYATRPRLFSLLQETSSLKEFYELFRISASSYWDNHYTFGKTSVASPKRLSKGFIQLLLINTIIPIKFSYARHQGRDIQQQVLAILGDIPAEKNRLAARFGELGFPLDNAKDSQGILQLYREYCSRNRCLHCAVGCNLLDGK